MLTPSTRLRLQAILERIRSSQPVTLQDRIYVQKFADRDQGVASWLLQARRHQLRGSGGDKEVKDGVDQLLEQMNLGSADPDTTFKPGEDDIGDWFGGAPGWLRRS